MRKRNKQTPYDDYLDYDNNNNKKDLDKSFEDDSSYSINDREYQEEIDSRHIENEDYSYQYGEQFPLDEEGVPHEDTPINQPNEKINGPTPQRAKYNAKMDTFLNNGIIIAGILLILVLVIAFLV